MGNEELETVEAVEAEKQLELRAERMKEIKAAFDAGELPNHASMQFALEEIRHLNNYLDAAEEDYDALKIELENARQYQAMAEVERDTAKQSVTRIREAILSIQVEVCNKICPTTWPTTEEQPHSSGCKMLKKITSLTEPK